MTMPWARRLDAARVVVRDDVVQDPVPDEPASMPQPLLPMADRARGVGADEVALEDVVGRAAAEDLDALAVVVGDHVPRAGGRAADRVVRGVGEHVDAVGVVAQLLGAGDVGADVVALDDDAGSWCRR